MEKRISIAEAKNKLPSLVHEVENGPPAVLTRYGKKVAVLVSISDFEKSKGVRQGFWSALTDWRKAAYRDDIAFTDGDFEKLRDRSPGRNDELGLLDR